MHDNETGVYYLKSRYYDPEVKRFINADGLVSTGQGVMGYNMYAYCNNNPVNMVDPGGMCSYVGVGPSCQKFDCCRYSCPTSYKYIKPTSFSGAQGQLYTALGSVYVSSKGGWTARIDPVSEEGPRHVHIEHKGNEVANQNDDGTPHHKNKCTQDPPGSLKKELLKKGWDWDAKDKAYKTPILWDDGKWRNGAGDILGSYEDYPFGLLPLPFGGWGLERCQYHSEFLYPCHNERRYML